MTMKMIIKGKRFSPLYRFDGGQYFVPDDGVGGEPWVALMDDGSLQTLFCGEHRPLPKGYEYEIVEGE